MVRLSVLFTKTTGWQPVLYTKNQEIIFRPFHQKSWNNFSIPFIIFYFYIFTWSDFPSIPSKNQIDLPSFPQKVKNWLSLLSIKNPGLNFRPQKSRTDFSSSPAKAKDWFFVLSSKNEGLIFRPPSKIMDCFYVLFIKNQRLILRPFPKKSRTDFTSFP